MSVWDKSTELISGTALEPIRKGGFYVIKDATDAPEAGEFHVLIISGRSNGIRRVYQIIWSVSTGVEYYRTNDGTGYGPWTARAGGGGEGGGPVSAISVLYNNAASGLTATNVQAAIDELEARLDTAESDIGDIEGTLALLSASIAEKSDASDVAEIDNRLQSAETKLNTIGAGAQITDLSYTRTESTLTIVSSDGADAVLPAASINAGVGGSPAAGVMSGADKVKLDGIEENATADMTGSEITGVLDAHLGGTDWRTGGGGGPNATNLSASADAATVTISSDTGADAVIAAASGSEAGVMTAADKNKLDSVQGGAEVNPTGTEIVSAINSTLGNTTWQSGGGGSPDPNTVLSTETANFTAGYTSTPHDLGSVSTGTIVIDPTQGNYQSLICNGPFVLSPPVTAGAYSVLIKITMGETAGTITMDPSWSSVSGAAFTTTNGTVFFVQVLVFGDTAKAVITQEGAPTGGTGNLSSDETAKLTAGFTAAGYNIGTIVSGTVVVDPVNGNFQYLINGGAFEMIAPTNPDDFSVVLKITNNSSAGAITWTGFDLIEGGDIPTTNGNTCLVQIIKIDGLIAATVKAITDPLIISLATPADVWTAADNKLMSSDLIESASAPVALLDASTIAIDWDEGVNRYVVLGANRTLGLPTHGQLGTWRFVTVYQNGTGGFTLTPHASYLLPGGEAPVVASAPNAISHLAIYCDKDGLFHLLPSGIGMAVAA